MEVVMQNLGMSFSNGENKVPVFSGLNLTVGSGESLAILGESGVGKTTLLYILGGLEVAEEGDVLLDQVNIGEKLRKGEDISIFRGRNIGMVFQFHYLLPEFDALENVCMPLRVQGEDLALGKERAQHLLERVGLKDRMDHRPGALSGGEQQRVALARALVTEPGLILADEPTGNLDGQNGGEVMKILKEFQRDSGLTLVMVTHSNESASAMDRRVRMTANNLVEED